MVGTGEKEDRGYIEGSRDAMQQERRRWEEGTDATGELQRSELGLIMTQFIKELRSGGGGLTHEEHITTKLGIL